MAPRAGAGPRSRLLRFEHRGYPASVSCLHTAGRGGAVLYFHGLGGSKEDFLGAWRVPGLRSRPLVAFDAPGCGATRGYRPGLALSVDDIVAFAGAVVDRLGLEDITVIGHSMGGLAALLFTLRHGSVRRLISVEGNLGPEDCSIYSRRVFRQPFLGREEAFMEALVQEMRASGRAGYDEAARVLRRNVEAPAFFDYCRSIVGYSDHWPLLDEFVALELPRLYIHGSENAHLTHIPRLRRVGVPVASVPDSSHFPFHSNPAAYYGAIDAFLRDTAA